MTRLLIHRRPYERLRSELSSLPGLEPVVMDDHGQIGGYSPADDVEFDAAWLSTEVFLSPASRAFIASLLRTPGLKWVQSAGAGYDHPIFHQILEKGARLSTSHAQAVGMSEFVLAGVLDHFQRGPERRAAQQQRAWRQLPFREIMGSSWLIVGFGAIGQAVAQRARAFGASVTGVRRTAEPHPFAERIVAVAALAEMLPQADVVVLCLPLTPATRGLFETRLFGRMKPGSVFVNVGRGALVDESSLLAGLAAGAPGHAILDVFDTEPQPPQSPFWSHSKVALTPHASALSDGLEARNDALFLDNLRRFLEGQPLLNELDPRESA
jgi:phosphoglycerate dehydrogenase-like enzyme